MAHSITDNAPLLGYQLIHTFETREEPEFGAYLVGWRDQLRRIFISANWLGYRHYPKLAASIGDHYPPISVLEKYVRPVTSWTISEVPDASQWVARIPDLSKMTQLCERLFTWGTSGGIADMLSKHVWAGMCLRVLLQVSCFCLIILNWILTSGLQRGGHTGTTSMSGGLPVVTRIKKAVASRGRAAGVQMYQVEASTGPLLDVINASLRGLRPQQRQPLQLPPQVTLRVLASVVDQALPDLVHQFKNRKRCKKQT